MVQPEQQGGNYEDPSVGNREHSDMACEHPDRVRSRRRTVPDARTRQGLKPILAVRGLVTFGAVTTRPDRPPPIEGTPVVAALFVPPANAEHLMAAVSSLQRVGVTVIAGGPSGESILPFRDAGCQCLLAGNTADLINQTWVHHHLPVLAVGDAVTVPDNFLGPALRLLADDLRVATVSFLSNDAGFLSFPAKNDPINRVPEGHDCTSVTRRLRDLGPHEPATPIPIAIGAAVLLSPSVLGLIGGLTPGPLGILEGTLADLSVRARSRGFIHLLDDSTYFVRHRAAGNGPPGIGTADDLDPVERHWVHISYPNEVEFVDHEANSATAPLAMAHGLARAKVLGLRVAVDGSYLGPHEMGTQVTILANVEALSRRDDVREVVVALRSDIPPYAARTLSLPKVVARAVDFDRLRDSGVAMSPTE